MMATSIPQNRNTYALSEAGLLQKYDVSGPRYTSYPTAAQFSSDFDGSDFLNAVYSSADAIASLSLYIDLSF